MNSAAEETWDDRGMTLQRAVVGKLRRGGERCEVVKNGQRAITLIAACPPNSWREGQPRTSGIYGLAEPAEWRIRYIGSSSHIEGRLWQHYFNRKEGGGQEKQLWLAKLRDRKEPIVAIVLEEMPLLEGMEGNMCRAEAERRWIEACHLADEADLNIKLTSRLTTAALRKENANLQALVEHQREQISKLQSELSRLRGTR